jgi:adenine-specific DNA-methyltransferase
MLKKHSSLMAYFGSKRKLCRHIFKHLDRPDGKEVVFIDAFMGGGSVSLYAKQIGYKVVAGDISLRGKITGKALIENSTQKVPPLPYLLTAKEYEPFTKEHYGEYFFDTISTMLDKMRASIRKRGDKPQELFLYMKLLAYFMPFGMLIRKLPKQPEGYKDRKDMEAAWLKAMADHKVFGRSVGEINNPYPMVKRLISNLNQAIFSNGRECVFKQGSAFDLIKEWKDKAEVLYMDPPYPGTLSYDESMWIDKSLVQDIDYEEKFGDEWTAKEKFLDTYDKYMQEAKDIPNLIMSIGNWDPNELLQVMRKYRPKAQLFSIKHNWLRSLSKKDKGDELMLIDLKKWYD